MKRNLFFLLIIFFGIVTTSNAQEKQIDNQQSTWINAAGNHKIANKFSIHTLISHRMVDYLSDRQQTLLRLGLNFHANKQVVFGAGYDWIKTFPYGEQPIGEAVVEQRIYERLQLKHNTGRFTFRHRYLFEHRFTKPNNETLVRHRIRYMFGVDYPLNNKKIEPKTYFLTFFNELFINYGKNANSIYFNQNWTFLGVGYKIDKTKTASIGYMIQHLPKTDFIRVENNHTLMCTYVQHVDLTKLGKKHKE